MEPTYRELESRGEVTWPMESEATFKYLVKWAASQKFDSGTRVLEIGCGGGELAFELAKRDIIVEACDFSETAIRLCNAKNPPENLTFFVGNAMTHRGFPNPPYDWIIANQFLQGIIGGDRVFFLKRVRENLKPNGKVLISTLLGIPDSLKDDVNPQTRVNSTNTLYFAELDQFAAELSQAELKAVRHIKVDENYRIFVLAKI